MFVINELQQSHFEKNVKVRSIYQVTALERLERILVQLRVCPSFNNTGYDRDLTPRQVAV